MPVLIFSGLLTTPATVLADEVTSEDVASEDSMATSAAEPVGASWYGSLRGVINFSSGADAEFKDGYSRWGVKGSGEVSEGLSAVYNFEHKIRITDAQQVQDGGRLAFVGLSGGFGAVTLGQIWSASYNHAGVLRDFPYFNTSPDTSVRIGNALSYAFSADAFSVQVDAIMDGGKDTGKAIDQLEFGMTVNLGDFGKIALAHTKVEDAMMAMDMGKYVDDKGTTDKDDDVTYEVHKITVEVAKDSDYYDSATKNMKNMDATNLLTGQTINAVEKGSLAFPKGLEFKLGACTAPTTNAPNPTDECVKGTAYATLTGPATSGTFSSVIKAVAPADVTTKNYGSKANHLSAQFDIGGITAALGYSQTKFNDPMKAMKQKTTFVGAKGNIGDTGLDWGVYHREIENAVEEDKQKSGKTKKWTVGLRKTLGGGAKTYVEHHNDGSKGHTVVGLHVDF